MILVILRDFVNEYIPECTHKWYSSLEHSFIPDYLHNFNDNVTGTVKSMYFAISFLFKTQGIDSDI